MVMRNARINAIRNPSARRGDGGDWRTMSIKAINQADKETLGPAQGYAAYNMQAAR